MASNIYGVLNSIWIFSLYRMSRQPLDAAKYDVKPDTHYSAKCTIDKTKILVLWSFSKILSFISRSNGYYWSSRNELRKTPTPPTASTNIVINSNAEIGAKRKLMLAITPNNNKIRDAVAKNQPRKFFEL